jgi:hypothetical protein
MDLRERQLAAAGLRWWLHDGAARFWLGLCQRQLAAAGLRWWKRLHDCPAWSELDVCEWRLVTTRLQLHDCAARRKLDLPERELAASRGTGT